MWHNTFTHTHTHTHNINFSLDEISDIAYEKILSENYAEAIMPPPPEPTPYAQPKRSPVEWEKDKIELAELNHAKAVIRNKDFPKYFDTEEGKFSLQRC